MKNYYAVESIGTNANTNRRHSATYMRFKSLAERDAWVINDGTKWKSITSRDADLRHEMNVAEIGWMHDGESLGESLV